MSEKFKSAKVKYTPEQLQMMEQGKFYIQVGSIVYQADNGKMAFNKDKAESFFFSLWEGMTELSKTGTKKERIEALNCLMNIRIIPLRFH